MYIFWTVNAHMHTPMRRCTTFEEAPVLQHTQCPNAMQSMLALGNGTTLSLEPPFAPRPPLDHGMHGAVSPPPPQRAPLPLPAPPPQVGLPMPAPIQRSPSLDLQPVAPPSAGTAPQDGTPPPGGTQQTPPPGGTQHVSLSATTDAIRQRIAGKNPSPAAAGTTGVQPKPVVKKAMKAKKDPKAMKAKTAKPAKPARKVWTTRPPLPSLGDDAVFYKGGVIYTSTTRKAFRVIQALPDYATETGVKWKGARPTAAEWGKALKKIDTYKK